VEHFQGWIGQGLWKELEWGQIVLRMFGLLPGIQELLHLGRKI